MASIIPGYNYDIFISYRQKDNKGDRWVSEFVDALKDELESTFKEEISVYFDINPHDGLLETNDVDESLKEKLKCLIFIPIISRTYCDPKSFAWEHEFKVFVEQASQDQFGLKVKLPGGNVASRVLPVQIHDLDNEDIKLCEAVLGGVLRGIEFIYKEPGINRPLTNYDDEKKNLNSTRYRNQINKLSNAVKEIISGLKSEPSESVSEQSKALTTIERPITAEKSIIVLPFENISSDPEQEYFSDGLTEEIITDLSYIDDLLVISRNSAMTFKGTKKKTKEIAVEVNVRYVLEGSVRKSGNNIRITAQLIDAFTDTHIWAEKYKGTLDDVFDIQEKVSSSIADSLKIKFSQDVRKQIVAQPIKDPYVYELYLKARYEDWQFNELSFNKGEELLNQGLKLAGDNALLYSELSHVTIQYVNNLLKDPNSYPELIEKAYQYAEKAISLNPVSATAYSAKALALFQGCNATESFKTFKKAIEVEPNHSDSMLFLLLGYLYAATGLDQYQAEVFMEKCRIMDPLSPLAKTCHGWRHIFLGQFQQAVDEFTEWQRVMEQIKSPANIWFVWLHGLNKDFEESFKIADQVTKNHPDHLMARLGSFMKYAWLKERKKAFDSITSALEMAAWWDDAYSLMMAEGYAVLEEYDKAFRWLNRAIDYGITNIPFLTEYDHFLENLRSDKRFEESIKKARNLLESFSK
jgi:TolB-like protein/TPR repeat protein